VKSFLFIGLIDFFWKWPAQAGPIGNAIIAGSSAKSRFWISNFQDKNALRWDADLFQSRKRSSFAIAIYYPITCGKDLYSGGPLR
jgi:hypothetical protein